MEIGEIAILVRLGLGAMATFFAILLCSKSMEESWLFVILGVLVSYAEIIISTLEKFGILQLDFLTVWGLSGFETVHQVLVNLPLILFIIAFVAAIAKRRLP